MITRIQFTVKDGSKIELATGTKLDGSQCIEHAISTAKAIGWKIEPKSSTSTRVVAVAPEAPIFDQLVNALMLRSGIPTYFDFTVTDHADGVVKGLTLIVFVTQPKPGDPNRFLEILNLVGKQMACEFLKDGITLRWQRSGKEFFQKIIENAASQSLNGEQFHEAIDKQRPDIVF